MKKTQETLMVTVAGQFVNGKAVPVYKENSKRTEWSDITYRVRTSRNC